MPMLPSLRCSSCPRFNAHVALASVRPPTHWHGAGIGISIGKVALYVAGGGFHPEHSLPVVLDVGCNRAELVEDKFYLVSCPCTL